MTHEINAIYIVIALVQKCINSVSSKGFEPIQKIWLSKSQFPNKDEYNNVVHSGVQ